MKRILTGAAIGSVVMFMWGFLFWAALGMGSKAIVGPADSAAAQQALAAIFAETGSYFVPFAENPDDPAYQALHKAGPIALVHFRAEGSDPMAPSTFAMGLALDFVVLVVMGVAISGIGAGFGRRVLLVLLAGLAGSLYAQLAGPIWWLQPWGLALTNVLFDAISWLLGGFVLAWVVRPQGPDSMAV